MKAKAAIDHVFVITKQKQKQKKQRQKKQGNDCFGRSSHSHKFGTVGVSFMKKLLSL